MKIRTFSALMGVALATGAALAGPAGAASPPPKDAVGTVSCLVTATVKYSPALKATSSGPTTVTLTSKLFSCTGSGDGATIAGGTSKTTHVDATNDCTSVLTGPPGTTSGQLKWKLNKGVKQKLNPSTITFTGGSSDLGPPITVDSTGSSTGGSFTGDSALSHSVLKQTLAQIQASCASKGGLKTLNVIQPGSTFALSS